jgi:hypothetical protein
MQSAMDPPKSHKRRGKAQENDENAKGYHLRGGDKRSFYEHP